MIPSAFVNVHATRNAGVDLSANFKRDSTSFLHDACCKRRIFIALQFPFCVCDLKQIVDDFGTMFKLSRWAVHHIVVEMRHSLNKKKNGKKKQHQTQKKRGTVKSFGKYPEEIIMIWAIVRNDPF